MKRKKQQPGEPDVIKSRWVSVSYKGTLCLALIVAIIGIFTILIFNVGYDKKSGWYWKPNNIEVHIKKNKGVEYER